MALLDAEWEVHAPSGDGSSSSRVGSPICSLVVVRTEGVGRSRLPASWGAVSFLHPIRSSLNRPWDRNLDRRTGKLLGATATSDVVDAHLTLLAMPGDQILTSDPDDIRRLIDERGVEVRIVRI